MLQRCVCVARPSAAMKIGSEKVIAPVRCTCAGHPCASERTDAAVVNIKFEFRLLHRCI